MDQVVEILIADDHELFRRTLRGFIENQPNWHVCGEAGDGIEAIEKAKSLRPDLVLMDINMPRMNGLEATRILRRDFPACKVVLVTQNHASIARQQAASVDANASVTKSDLTRDLRPTVETVFGSRTSPVATAMQAESGDEWVRGGGALGRLVRQCDWSKTPLGPIDNWPQSLKIAVRILLTSRFAMWMSWGPELTVLYNDAYAKMTLGKKHPWALGKPSWQVWKEIWSDIGPRIERVLKTGDATWDEGLMLFLERSGYREETYHTFSYSPLSNEEGKVSGHLCVVSEETDRIIGERRLNTLRSLASELSQTTTEQDVAASIARVLTENQHDMPFTLTYLFNGSHARLVSRTGIGSGHPAAPLSIDLAAENPAWPLAEILGQKDFFLVENLQSHFPSIPTGVWQDPPARAIVLPIVGHTQDAPAGSIVVALNPYRPLDVSYGGFLNLVAGQISASVSNARAYQEERKRAEALAEIDRAKTAFFSNVSHEFRTPLTLMLGPLQDLLSRSQTHLSPTAAQQLELVNRNGARLLRLVNTLLDFSRIEAGRVKAIYQPTDLAAFTAELAGVFRSATERAGLELTVNCQPLSDAAYVDRDMWEKIILNLVSNAFKFTFDGGIEVTLAQVGNSVELRVRDSGVGVPPEEIPHLFDRFHRVPNTRSRTHEGTGIGLALVHELVKLHGGSMRVESNIDKGTAFFVTIPLGRSHLPAEQVGGERTPASTATGANPFVQEALRWLPDSDSLDQEELPLEGDLLPVPCPPASEEGRMRVLIADDNADMRQYLARLLSERYQVVTVADGHLALESIRKQAPDLVLSDIMMPNLDGFALLQALRSDAATNTIPVILLSARAGEESRVEGIDAGADDYLIKPFSARELLARVQTHLELARVRREANELLRKSEERLQNDLRQLSGKLLQLQDEERRAISRELHDSAGQTLTVLSMILGQMEQLATKDDSQFAQKLGEAQDLLLRVTQEIRTTSYLLHPPLLDESGIAAALRWYIDGLAQRTPLKIELTVSEEFRRLPREIELAMFRIVQESLTNVLRHSGSKVASIRLARNSDFITLDIEDRGMGISDEKLAAINEGRSGVGISGMRDRVRHLNGEMRVHSTGTGTQVSIKLPATPLGSSETAKVAQTSIAESPKAS